MNGHNLQIILRVWMDLEREGDGPWELYVNELMSGMQMGNTLIDRYKCKRRKTYS